MKVVNLKDYMSSKPAKRPREICFRSNAFRGPGGDFISVVLNARVENGDVEGVLAQVIQNGGFGVTCPDGIYRFVPWPCAVVEIQEL